MTAHARRSLARSLVALTLGVAAAVGTLAMDVAAGLLVPLPVSNLRTLLGSLVSAVLTIAVFTLWMRTVVVGLAAGRVSPRIVVGHLDDRFQHEVAAWMVGGFGYVVTVLLGLPAATDGSAPGVPATSLAGSVVVTVAAFVAVLLALRAAIRSMSMSQLVRNLTDQALEVLRRPRGPDDPPVPSPPIQRAGTRIDGDAMGWVRDIDYRQILGALPPRTTLTMHIAVGDFVAPAELLAHADTALGDEAAEQIRGAVSLTDSRDPTRDLAFAIEQLIDVGQHAMSPTSNDTSTAHEVLVHLRVVLRMLLQDGKFSCALNGEDGRHVVSEDIWDPADHIEMACARLRHQAPQMPTIVGPIRETFSSLQRTAAEVGDDRSAEVLQRHLDALLHAGNDDAVSTR